MDVDGKKGEEYLDDLATDKRFLPYLDQAGRFTHQGQGEPRRREEKGSRSTAHDADYQFAPLRRGAAVLHRATALSLDGSHNLKLTDAATSDDALELRLTATQFQQHRPAATADGARPGEVRLPDAGPPGRPAAGAHGLRASTR